MSSFLSPRAEVNAVFSFCCGTLLALTVLFALEEFHTKVVLATTIFAIGCATSRRASSGGSAKHLVDYARRTQEMRGKVCLVTGANAGIGYYTALGLAQTGATVVITCRSTMLLETTARRLRDDLRQRGFAKQNEHIGNVVCDLLPLDLGDFSSIRSFASSFHRKFKRLDVLVNNAGMMTTNDDYVTEDDFERHTGVNFLGPVLLTDLLLPAITSVNGRVVNVASAAHRLPQQKGFKPDELVALLDELNDLRPEDAAPPRLSGKGNGTGKSFLRYGLSKLCNIYFSHELVQRNVRSVSLHPGVVASNFALAIVPQWFFDAFFKVSLTFLKTPDEGAQTSLYCCLCDDTELTPHAPRTAQTSTGAVSPTVGASYFVDCRNASTTMTTMAQDLVAGRDVMTWARRQLLRVNDAPYSE